MIYILRLCPPIGTSKLCSSSRGYEVLSVDHREIHIYGGVWASAEWNQYRAIRLHFLERLQELFKAVEPSSHVPSVHA